MTQEVLDLHPPAGGEVVDDDDVVVLSEVICKVCIRPAPPVTMERMKRLWQRGCLGLSELNRHSRFDTGLRGHLLAVLHPPPIILTIIATTPSAPRPAALPWPSPPATSSSRLKKVYP